MKKMSFLLLSMISVSAFAKDNFTSTTLDFVQKNNLLDKVRVYASKKIAVTYENRKIENTEVNEGDINNVVNQQIKTKIVKTSTKGKIIDFHKRHTYYGSYVDGVYVSFESKCQTKDCAYAFIVDDGKYHLSEIPGLQDHYITKKKFGLFGKKAWKVVLEFNQNELMNIIKTKEYADGVE